jgi:hypothetical protein
MIHTATLFAAITWRTAQPITEFREFDPVDNAPARFRTEARIAYDAHNFYVFIRAYDRGPPGRERGGGHALVRRRHERPVPRASREHLLDQGIALV